ncbi:MAG: molybdopterin dinucleotide binding domain-containing protein [Promethearchaeota archaeon]
MAVIKIDITSGATVAQGVVAKGGGKKLTDYKNTAALVFLDKEDFKRLETYPGTSVELRNEWGKVIVTAQMTPDGPHPGFGFMPRGPWANVIISPDTKSSGCPGYKRTPVEIEPKPGLLPLEMADLMRQEYLNKL